MVYTLHLDLGCVHFSLVLVPGDQYTRYCSGPSLVCNKHWSAANGGVTNGGLRGVWPPCPGNRPKSAFFALFLPFSAFSGGPGQHLKNPENGGKRPFSSDILGFA